MFELETYVDKKGKMHAVINEGQEFKASNKQDLINQVLSIKENYIKEFDKLIVKLEIWCSEQELENNNDAR